MLMISRRVGERIVLDDATEIVVTEIHRRTVRLGVRAAPGTQVMRGEVRDAIEQENQRAAQSAWDTDSGQATDLSRRPSTRPTAEPAQAPSASQRPARDLLAPRSAT